MANVLGENQYFDNECAFCRVYSEAAKRALERTFLKNRVSYFVQWEEKNIFQKIFGGKEGRRNTFIIRINSSDIGRATALIEGLPDIKILTPEPEPDWSPKEKLRREREMAEQNEDVEEELND